MSEVEHQKRLRAEELRRDVEAIMTPRHRRNWFRTLEYVIAGAFLALMVALTTLVSLEIYIRLMAL